MHFPKRGLPIGEELEAQLAIGDINELLGNGSLSALASCHWMLALSLFVVATDRATFNMPGLRSTAATEPLGPTRAAATRATTPVPQATSTTRSPGFG